MPNESAKLIKIGEAAKLLGVSVRTLRYWEEKGFLRPIKTPGGTRLYRLEEMDKFSKPGFSAQIASDTRENKSVNSFSQNQTSVELDRETPSAYITKLGDKIDSQIQTPFGLNPETNRWQAEIEAVSTPRTIVLRSKLAGFVNVSAVTLLFFILGWTVLTGSYIFKPEQTLSFAQGIIRQLDRAGAAGIVTGLDGSSKKMAVWLNPKLDRHLAMSGAETNNYSIPSLISSQGEVLAAENQQYKLTISVDTSIEGSLSSHSLTLSDPSNQLGLGSNLVVSASEQTSPNIATIPPLSGDSTFLFTDQTQTISNKTISGADNTVTNLPNSALVNTGVTINTSGTLTGGGVVALGGTITLTGSGSGVTSLTAGTGIGVSGSTGDVTITNNGVTSLTGTSNQVIVSGSTGGVTLTLPQSIATTSTVQFGNIGIGTTQAQEVLDVNGRIYLYDSSAPSITTNRLYAVSGNLVWNGVDLTSGGSLPGGTNGQTLYNSTGTWSATSNLYNDSTNVGIGTTSPGALLGVGSTAQFQVDSTGDIVKIHNVAYSWPSSQGAAGSVLVDDGNGSLSWASSGGSGAVGYWTRSLGTLSPTTSGDAISVTGGATLTGTVNINTTGSSSTSIGNSSGTLTINSSGTSFWTNTSGNLTLSTATSGTLALTSAGLLNISSTGANLALSTITSGNITLAPAGTGSVQFSAGTTTGTGTTAGVSVAANSLQSGTAVDISSSSTAGTGSDASRLLNLSRSGVNANSAHIAYGVYSTVTNTGTSSTNVGGYFSASGGSNNYAAIFANGNVGVGTTIPGSLLHVAGALRLGVDTGTTGTVVFQNSTNAFTTTIQSGAPGSSFSLTLPTSSGSNGDCLQTNGAGGVLSFGACTGGAGGGVTSIDGQTGIITLSNSSGSGSTVTIDNAAADGSTKGIATFNATNFSAASGIINTIQSIATSASPSFTGLSLTGLSSAAGSGLCISGGTVSTCSSGSSAGTLQSDYDNGNSIATSTGRNVAITLSAGLASPTLFSITQSHASGTSALYLNNANASGTNTNGLLVEQTGAGTLTNGINITQTAGILTNALTFGGTFTKLINSTNFNVTNAGALTAVGVDSGSGLLQGTGGITVTGTGNINATGTAVTNIGNSTGTLTLVSGGNSGWTNTSGALTLSTVSSGAINLTAAHTAGQTTTAAFNIKTSTDLGASDELVQIGDSAADFFTIMGNGNVGIGTSNPDLANLQVSKSFTDSNGTAMYAFPAINVTSSAANNLIGLRAYMDTTVSSGITNSGYLRAGFLAALRSNSGDAGMLSEQSALVLQYGHDSTVGATAVTTDSYGLYIQPYQGKALSTITNAYAIKIASPFTTGATVTNNYGIYQESTSQKNYFAGNVGIGTTSPSGTFHLNLDSTSTSIMTGGSLTNKQLLLSNNSTTAVGMYTGIALNTGAGDTGSAIVNEVTDTANSSTSSLHFYVNGGSGWTDSTSTLTLMGVTGSNTGNVGIGTTSPVVLLHLSKAAGASLQDLVAIDNITNAAANGNGGRLLFRGNDSSGNLRNYGGIAGFTDNFTGIGGGVSLYYTTTGGTVSEGMRISSTGNVGIGTTVPASKLDIDTSSNTLGLRLRGTAETTEIGDIYMAAGGALTLSTANTGAVSAYIEADPEDDQFGFIVRDSSTGSTVYSNFYTNDAATDYLNINVGASNATAGLVLQTGGNVGIGTTTPGALLETTKTYSGTTTGEQFGIKSTTNYSIADTGLKQGLRVNASTTHTTGNIADLTGVLSLTYKSAAGTIGNAYGIWTRVDNTVASGAITNAYGLYIETGDRTGSVTNDYGVYQVDTSAKNYFGGNVGIGTTSPGLQLHVYGTGGAVGQLIETTSASPGANVAYGQYKNTGGSFYIGRDATNGGQIVSGSTGYSGVLSVSGAYSMHLATNSTIAQTITSAGNVGIGTTGPNTKLQVFGSQAVGTVSVENIFTIYRALNGGVSQPNAVSFSLGRYSIADTNSHSRLDIQLAEGTGLDTTVMTMQANGNVGIGTTAAGSKLQVGYASGTGNLVVYGASVTCTIGNGTSATNCSSSDQRLKSNITSLDSTKGLDAINALNPVSYNWNRWMQTNNAADPNTHYGFIAQEVAQVLPDLVHQDPNTNFYTMDYQSLSGVLVKSIQQLSTQTAAAFKLSADGSLNIPALKVGKLVLDPSLDLSGSANSEGTLSYAVMSLEDRVTSLEQAVGNTAPTSAAGLTAAVSSLSNQVAGIATDSAAIKSRTDTLEQSIEQTSTHLADLQSLIDNFLNESSASAVSNVQNNTVEVTPPDILTATGSAELANLKVNEQISTLRLSATEATISGTLKSLGESFLGQTTVAGTLTQDGSLSISGGNTINALPILYLQNSPLASRVDIFNGVITMDVSGQLSVNKLVVKSNASNPTIGSGVIKAGDSKVTISTNQITSSSKVFVTPRVKTNGQVLAVDEITAGSSFSVSIEQQASNDINFDWWIVGTE